MTLQLRATEKLTNKNFLNIKLMLILYLFLDKYTLARHMKTCNPNRKGKKGYCHLCNLLMLKTSVKRHIYRVHCKNSFHKRIYCLFCFNSFLKIMGFICLFFILLFLTFRVKLVCTFLIIKSLNPYFYTHINVF